MASIESRTSLVKFARSPRTDPPGKYFFSMKNTAKIYITVYVGAATAESGSDFDNVFDKIWPFGLGPARVLHPTLRWDRRSARRRVGTPQRARATMACASAAGVAFARLSLGRGTVRGLHYFLSFSPPPLRILFSSVRFRRKLSQLS